MATSHNRHPQPTRAPTPRIVVRQIESAPADPYMRGFVHGLVAAAVVAVLSVAIMYLGTLVSLGRI